MKKLKLSTQNKNRIIALLVGMLGLLTLSVFFDLFYEMNDDVMINKILAGTYTGIPDGHNIQMLYPLAFLISLFYRIVPSIPWFALFLTGCMLLSFYLVMIKGLSYMQTRMQKTVYTVFVVLLYAGLLLWEMIFMQYTVVCGVLAMTASVCLFLTPRGLSIRQFIHQNMISIVLIVLAFNLRTEMLLLMSPFIAIAGLLKWSGEAKFFCRESFIKYGTILGSIVILMTGSLGVHKMAYHTEEWQEFEAFFDARTSVYDFTWYPDYDTNQTFYDSIGISRGQYSLIDNYNFGLDERINTQVLEQIAEYQTGKEKAEVDITAKVKDTIWKYRYLLTHFDLSAEHETRVMPYNALVIILYIWLILSAIMHRDGSYIWKIPVMLLFRTIPWLYILWKGRVVARLTHPMFLIEIMILCSCIFIYQITCYAESNENRKTTKYLQSYHIINVVFAILITGVLLITLPASVKTAKMQQQQREEINTTDLALKQYCSTHPENYYLVDVYSTVSFSETMFKNQNEYPVNYDILGGWFARSPLCTQKMQQYGITNIEEDILTAPNVYFVVEEDSDLSWLNEYYEESGKDISIEKVDKLNSNLILNIYQIREK